MKDNIESIQDRLHSEKQKIQEKLTKNEIIKDNVPKNENIENYKLINDIFDRDYSSDDKNSEIDGNRIVSFILGISLVAVIVSLFLKIGSYSLSRIYESIETVSVSQQISSNSTSASMTVSGVGFFFVIFIGILIMATFLLPHERNDWR